MSNQTLDKSSVTMNITSPIRRVTAETLLSIQSDLSDSNEEINVDTNVLHSSISIKEVRSNSYNFVQ